MLKFANLFTLSAIAVVTAIPLSASATAIDGALDVPFSTNTVTSMPRQSVSLAIQSDGKILTSNIDFVTRLNADGTLESGPLNSPGFDGIKNIAVDSSNRILVGGSFTAGDCVCGSGALTRLLPDGSVDGSFNIGTGFDGNVQKIQVLPDGKILLAGTFTHLDGNPVRPIVRLNQDGTLDPSWALDPSITSTNFSALTLLNDGSVIAAGGNLTASPDSFVYKLTSTGGRDPAFNIVTCTPNGSTDITSIKKTPSGSFVLAGTFQGCANHLSEGIIQITSTGAFDPTFDTGGGLTGGNSGQYGVDLYVQLDGKVILVGVFSGYNTTLTSGIIRLLPNGSVDPTFELGAGFDPNNQGKAMAIQPSGGILIGGIISGFNGTTVGNIIRLYNAPDVAPGPDNHTLPNTGMNTIFQSAIALGGLIMVLAGIALFRRKRSS